MTHVLVTGGNGYIGCLLVDQLLDAGHEVSVVDWMVFGEHPLRVHKGNPKFRLIRQDVRKIAPRILSGVDVICDLAALSNDPSGDLDEELTREINFHARARLGRIAKAVGVKRYILASSCSVYGVNGGEVADETSPLSPQTAYAECNQKSEQALFALSDRDFSVTAFRNATVFGLSRRMRFDLVVNIMTLAAVRDGRLEIHGDGRQHRPFVHVQDVGRAFRAAIEAPVKTVEGQVFNLGIGNFTIGDIAAKVAQTLPMPVDVSYAPSSADNRDYTVSFDKIREVLGFEPEVRVEEGITEVFIALQTNRTFPSFETKTLDVYSALIKADQMKLYGNAVN